MKRQKIAAGILCAGLLALSSDRVWGREPDWRLAHEDDFSRAALGTDWLILRGDWHINAQGQLQIQRQWSSHSHLMSTVPLRGKNVRVEFDLSIPSGQAGRFGAFLQAGALGWGGGGIDDRVGAEFVGVPADKVGEAPAKDDGGADMPRISLDATHHIVISLADGTYDVRVDGKSVRSGTATQGRSLVNDTLQFSACPGGMVDNLKIFTAPMARPLPEWNAAPAEENRRATVFADTFIDPGKPDCGIQDAIDALPPGGGVVILPRGVFTLRRFLELRSHTTLMGQGPETVLQAMDATASEVEKVLSANGAHTLVMKGPHDFRPGDAFAYGSPLGARACWGHPGMPRTPGSVRLLVLAADGNTLRVNAAPPPEVARFGKTVIVHFFPPVCSYESEYAEVKDLAIRGPGKSEGAGGGFMVNPVTFGVTSQPRLHRLAIRDFPADGISAQVCDDGRFLDNTISGVSQGLHPGTTTLRTIVARNYSVDNGAGLYFCWYNHNGIYWRNAVKNFTGYPDAGDTFNTLACNRLVEGMAITCGYNGCLFHNDMASLTVFGTIRNQAELESTIGPGGRSYNVAPRYFTIGLNRIGRLVFYKYIGGNVAAGNRGIKTALPEVEYQVNVPKPDAKTFEYRKENGLPDRNVFALEPKFPEVDGLPDPIARTDPVPPPALPAPVLDGREFYRPEAPDCGFQKALDRLAPTGGTLRLPGGRYVLAQPLRVPARVTVTGYGTGTILLGGGTTGGVFVVEGAEGVTLRELAIEGNWGAEAVRDAAVAASKASGLSLIALDIRGWPGPAVRVAGGRDLVVRDCRVLRCPGTAYAVVDVEGALLETCSAVQGRLGFEVRGGRGARLFGNVAGLNLGDGFVIRSPGALAAANNANNNLCDGLRVEEADGVTLAGNTCAGNNQAGREFAGIRLAGGARRTRVLYNNCGDDQLYATQLVGIREEPGAARSEIRYNGTATMCTRRGHEKEPSLLAAGKGSTVADNWTETILPSNDSIESIEARPVTTR